MFVFKRVENENGLDTSVFDKQHAEALRYCIRSHCDIYISSMARANFVKLSVRGRMWTLYDGATCLDSSVGRAAARIARWSVVRFHIPAHIFCSVPSWLSHGEVDDSSGGGQGFLSRSHFHCKCRLLSSITNKNFAYLFSVEPELFKRYSPWRICKNWSRFRGRPHTSEFHVLTK